MECAFSAILANPDCMALFVRADIRDALRDEGRIEYPIGHDLTAFDQTMLMLFVVRPSIVQGANMVPHQDVAFCPLVCVLIPFLQLMREQHVQQFIAFSLTGLIDAGGISRVAVQHLATCDGMRQKDWMNGRWALGLLLWCQRRALAARLCAHFFPEFIEVMGGC